MTPRDFSIALLGALGLPECEDNIAALVAWCASEGGHYVAKWAAFNPLCTTQPMQGDRGPGNKYGVRAYTSWRMGLDATVKTLTNGHYSDILASLRACAPALDTMHTIGRNPAWGTFTLATATSAKAFSYYGAKADPTGSTLAGGGGGLLALLGVGAALWWYLRARA